MFSPQAEPRFLWNNYMLEPLIDNKVFLPAHHVLFVPLDFFQNLIHIYPPNYAILLVQLDPFLLPIIQGNILILVLLENYNYNLL